MKVIYKITYTNAKIYIGKYLTNTLMYLGSVNSDIIAEDFIPEQKKNFTLRKEILFEPKNENELNKIELMLISKYKSNDLQIGYNRYP